MAKDTKIALRNQVIYSVYVRNHSKEGNFAGVARDLDRIKSLGTDIIWLMPIHPIGQENRKGVLGSPYSIWDYRTVNPEYGTKQEFFELVELIHQKGMKCILDVVYNHTSTDSPMIRHRPECYYHKPDGELGNRCGAWSDVYDLDYSNRSLWDYQIDTLKMWAEHVDGFRCDVASLVPVDFWLKAREEVEKVRKGCIWLAESVDSAFLRAGRNQGIPVWSDGELYQAFDICYDYDVRDYRDAYLQGKRPLEFYLAAVDRQEEIYPQNYIKLRFLENHDTRRAAALIPDEKSLRNWTAFCYFQKGTTLVYAGQEVEAPRTPSLFKKDPVNWETGKDLSGLMRTLYQIKQDPIMADGSYAVWDAGNDVAAAAYEKDGKKRVGVFTLKGKEAPVAVSLPDGVYRNLIDNLGVKVSGGRLTTNGEPVILEVL